MCPAFEISEAHFDLSSHDIDPQIYSTQLLTNQPARDAHWSTGKLAT
jgi:hypothetical protein